MKGKLGMLGLMAGIVALGEMGYSDPNKGDNDLKPKDINITPKQPPLPKGCKEYMFNKNGGFSTERMLREEIVFKCIAASDKSAKKKFNTFITNQ